MSKKILLLLALSVTVNAYAKAPATHANVSHVALKNVTAGVKSDQTCLPEWGDFTLVDLNENNKLVRCIYNDGTMGYGLSGDFVPVSGPWQTDGQNDYWCSESAKACAFSLRKK